MSNAALASVVSATYPFCSLSLELQTLPRTISSVVFPVADSVPKYDAELLRIAPIIKQQLYEAYNYKVQLCQQTDSPPPSII